MTAFSKLQIDSVEDNIYFLERERNELHYQIYVFYSREKLFEYDLTLEELDSQYYELEMLEKKYRLELCKERDARASEKLKSEMKEIATEPEHVEDTNTEDPIEEVKQVEDINIIIEEQVEETKPQLDCYQIIEDHKVANAFIEVEHINFIIPEYLPKHPSLAFQFPEFLAPQPFCK
ncbi:hypothetical protein OROHE_001930 [Orobanche hederae]